MLTDADVRGRSASITTSCRAGSPASPGTLSSRAAGKCSGRGQAPAPPVAGLDAFGVDFVSPATGTFSSRPLETLSGPQPADERRRPEGAAVLLEARREVHDLHGPALPVVQHGLQDRRIAPVALLGMLEVEQLDVPETLLGAAMVVDQGAEDGVAVEAGQAAPDDPGSRVDQRGEAAVADDGEVEIGRGRDLGPGRRAAAERPQAGAIPFRASPCWSPIVSPTVTQRQRS